MFFDDFEGNALLPHWNQPPPSDWGYNVSNGMLNVTNLYYPSHPKHPSNFAWMNTLFMPQTDFRIDVWMGWEAGQQPHRLAVHVGGPFQGNPIIASMGYTNDGSGPFIFAGASNQAQFMPAPSPGIHHFTVSRTGTQFNFLFNGSPFASFTDNFGTAAAAINFEFLGPYPGTLGAFHIDRVVVVPAPGMLLTLSAILLLASTRRRRTDSGFQRSICSHRSQE